ncbi:hypothetical protein ACLOJK_022441, partial [Asimina triloba]
VSIIYQPTTNHIVMCTRSLAASVYMEKRMKELKDRRAAVVRESPVKGMEPQKGVRVECLLAIGQKPYLHLASLIHAYTDLSIEVQMSGIRSMIGHSYNSYFESNKRSKKPLHNSKENIKRIYLVFCNNIKKPLYDPWLIEIFRHLHLLNNQRLEGL